MRQIFYILIFFTFLFPYSHAIEREELKDITIISREQWWADEEYTYSDSNYWKEILEKRNDESEKELTEKQKKEQEKKKEDYKASLNYINQNFKEQNTITKRTFFENDRPLAWSIQKSDYINAIVVHHTHGEYDSSYEGIRQIYKYHSLNNEWGDIGYNYLIGYNGEIFEGRKWGDYSVGAHSKWNNISTVGISIIGDYHHKGINTLQYISLEKLIQHLSLKYGIDLSKDYYYNMNCSGAACNIFPLETNLHETLAGHRDTWHTDCPGDILYKQIEQIQFDNLELTRGLIPVKRWEVSPYFKDTQSLWNSHQEVIQILQQFDKEKLQQLINIIDARLEQNPKKSIWNKLRIIKTIAIHILEA